MVKIDYNLQNWENKKSWKINFENDIPRHPVKEGGHGNLPEILVSLVYLENQELQSSWQRRTKTTLKGQHS